MKQRNTLQWLSIVTGKAKLLVGVLVAVQAVRIFYKRVKGKLHR